MCKILTLKTENLRTETHRIENLKKGEIRSQQTHWHPKKIDTYSLTTREAVMKKIG